MGNFIFHYGCVKAGKTSHLIDTAENYEKAGKNILVIAPIIVKIKKITSRNKRTFRLDLNIIESYNLMKFDPEDHKLQYKTHIFYLNNYSAIFIEEAHFFHPDVINFFRNLSSVITADVMLYGLTTDYNSHLFPGSKRILEVADDIIHIRTKCYKCKRHASFNKKIDNTNNISTVQVSQKIFEPTCYDCFWNKD